MGHIVRPDGTIKTSASLFSRVASIAHPDNHPIFGRIEKDEREWIITKQEPYVRPADFVEQLRRTITKP